MKVTEVLKEDIDWSQWSESQLQAAASLGLGPKYKPTPRKTYECGGCHKNTAYRKTFHEDTEMEESGLYCPECKWTERNL